MADLDLSRVLDDFFKDPDAENKLKGIMESLGINADGKENPASSDTSDNLGDFSPDIGKIMKIKSLYDNALSPSDPKMKLLSALKPYLSEERIKSLDSMVKLFRIYKIITGLSDSDLLKELF